MNKFLIDITKNNNSEVKGIGSRRFFRSFYEGIGNIKKKTIYLYGASSKVGKTTVVDYLHILVPYIEGYRNIKYYYFAWEIDIEEKMASFCSFFLKYKYDLEITSDEVLGLERKLTDKELELIGKIYNEELIELFGTYNNQGKLVTPGIITYIEDRMTSEEFKDKLKEISLVHGVYDKDVYVWKDITQHVHILVDHIGKVSKGRLMAKQAIDELTDTSVIFRNKCHFTFILISQFNRSLGAIDRRGLLSMNIKPEKSDFKDSSNGAEDCNFLVALFNPLLFNELDKFKINNRIITLRRREEIEVSAGFRGLYLLEARKKKPFELPFVITNSYSIEDYKTS